MPFTDRYNPLNPSHFRDGRLVSAPSALSTVQLKSVVNRNANSPRCHLSSRLKFGYTDRLTMTCVRFVDVYGECKIENVYCQWLWSAIKYNVRTITLVLQCNVCYPKCPAQVNMSITSQVWAVSSSHSGTRTSAHTRDERIPREMNKCLVCKWQGDGVNSQRSGGWTTKCKHIFNRKSFTENLLCGKSIWYVNRQTPFKRKRCMCDCEIGTCVSVRAAATTAQWRSLFPSTIMSSHIIGVSANVTLRYIRHEQDRRIG